MKPEKYSQATEVALVSGRHLATVVWSLSTAASEQERKRARGACEYFSGWSKSFNNNSNFPLGN